MATTSLDPVLEGPIAAVRAVDRTWWKEAVFYQVYLRSFADSDGDGIGDLRGLIDRIDYLASLGITAIWLNPIYRSPNDDMGYDISDYYAIMAEFGTMADFDELLAKLHDRGMRLVMDLVVNHTSDEHVWFAQSRSSRDNPYRDYYHWWPAERGTPPRRHSFFDPEGDAWRYDAPSDAYYLHYFSAKQPDLNWENPELRQEIYRMMRYWFDKGVDGFRMDVITFIAKDMSYPDGGPGHGHATWEEFYASEPRLHDFVREMHEEVFSRYDAVSIAEAMGIDTEGMLKLVAPERRELDMGFEFDHAFIGQGFRRQPNADYGDLVAFKRAISRWDEEVASKAWLATYLGNHDQPRMVSRWGDDSDQWRMRSAKALHTLLLSLRGTPHCFQGDEIAMKNARFERIEDYRDIETIAWHAQLAHEGGDLDAFIEWQKLTARDNARTPMQWSGDGEAGFTTGRPWLRVTPDFDTVNVAGQDSDPDSCLNYFRRMVRVRRDNPVLVYGDFALLVPDHPQIFAYRRQLDDTTAFVLLNMSSEPASMPRPDDIVSAQKLIGNDDADPWAGDMIALAPWAASVWLTTEGR